MTKDKRDKLNVYKSKLKQRLEDSKTSTPSKHTLRPKQYKAYLINELAIVTTLLEEDALAQTK